MYWLLDCRDMIQWVNAREKKEDISDIHWYFTLMNYRMMIIKFYGNQRSIGGHDNQ